MMDIKEYQEWTRTTAIYPPKDALPYLCLGIANEAGEVAGKMKKRIRGDAGTYDTDLLKEVGDVMWYAARICDELGYDLDLILRNNMDKLEDRAKRGAIKGSGDNR